MDPANKPASFRRNMSIGIEVRDEVKEDADAGEVCPTPTIAEVDAAFEKELEKLEAEKKS
eukprot:gene4182-14284_t